MSTLQEIRLGIKTIPDETRKKFFYALLIILTAFLAFGLGRLSVFYGQASDFKITYPEAQAAGPHTNSIGVGAGESVS